MMRWIKVFGFGVVGHELPDDNGEFHGRGIGIRFFGRWLIEIMWAAR